MPSFEFTRTYPTFSYTQPSVNYLMSLPIQPPTSSNIFTVYSLILLWSRVLHPPLPSTTSINSLCWFLPRAHKAESNSIAVITSLTHYTMRSLPMLPTTSISSSSSFLLRRPTLSSVYAGAPPTTVSSTGSSTYASNINYTSLSTHLPTNQFVHVE